MTDIKRDYSLSITYSEKMTFSESIKTCFSKYADFSGTASRSEYWYFSLFELFCYLGALIISSATNSAVILGLLILGLLLPGLSVSVRRLRDGAFSPWLVLLILIPYIGFIPLIVLYCQPSKPAGKANTNTQPQYGAAQIGTKQYCSNCGTIQSHNELFCKNCGKEH